MIKRSKREVVSCTILLGCIVALAGAGCHPGSSDPRINTAPGVQSDTLASNIITRPIGDFVSVVIGEGIEVSDVKERRTDTGFLQIQISGYNHSVRRKLFDYKVEWLDADGMVVDTAMSRWMPMSAMPKSEFSFKADAPNPRAVSWRINTRVNKNVQ